MSSGHVVAGKLRVGISHNKPDTTDEPAAALGCSRPASASSGMRGTSSSLAESHLTHRLFRQILGRIERLTWHPT
jgi:hypothetical protein